MNEPFSAESAPPPPVKQASAAQKWSVLWLGAAIILIDQLTKWRIEATMPLNTSTTPVPALDPYFRFTHVANYGTAWSLFDGGRVLFAGLAVVVAIGLVIFNFSLSLHHPRLRFALGCILGGALGNFVDRVRLGYVTDFLNFNFYPLLEIPWLRWLLDFPIFNGADIAISTGVALLAYLMWREGEAFPAGQPVADSAESSAPRA